jgi:hypothetical protein
MQPDVSRCTRQTIPPLATRCDEKNDATKTWETFVASIVHPIGVQRCNDATKKRFPCAFVASKIHMQRCNEEQLPPRGTQFGVAKRR